MMGVEFHCDDCRDHVFRADVAAPPIPHVCLTCLWLRTLDPRDREAIRQRQQQVEAA